MKGVKRELVLISSVFCYGRRFWRYFGFGFGLLVPARREEPLIVYDKVLITDQNGKEYAYKEAYTHRTSNAYTGRAFITVIEKNGRETIHDPLPSRWTQEQRVLAV